MSASREWLVFKIYEFDIVYEMYMKVYEMDNAYENTWIDT
jgi:hypothetical protein